VQEEPKTPKQLAEEEAEKFLANALQAVRDRYRNVNATLGRQMSGRRDDFMKERTIQTIREWFTVKHEDLGEPDPDVYVVVGSIFCGVMQNVTDDRLVQEDVSNWADHWSSRGLTSSILLDGGAFDTVAHDLDGAVEHRRRIAGLRQARSEKEQHDSEVSESNELERMIKRLKEAASAHIEYGNQGDAADAVAEAIVYADFAAQLKQHGLDESTVFDMVAELSKLIEQSKKILPRLTTDTVKQFEARVLLPYYEKHQEEFRQRVHERHEEAERAQAALDEAIAKANSESEMQEISRQLSSLNATLSSQSQDVSRIKWLDMLDGLLGH
jgi:hypothetical protein